MLLLLALLLLRWAVVGADEEDGIPFCRKLLLNSTDTGLRVSREVSVRDFSHLHLYKQLHCCFANYDRIDWYFNRQRVMPGSASYNITSFIHLEDGNQSLTSYKLHRRDSGVYTCVAWKGGYNLTHSVNLTVEVHDEFEDAPVLTIIPSNKYAWEGESKRFCCEAFIGFGIITPSMSEVVWIPSRSNMYFTNSSIASMISYNRSQGQILGAYLSFNPVTRGAFGTYTCQVSNGIGPPKMYNVTLIEGDDPNEKVRESYQAAVVILAVFSAVFLLTVTMVTHWRLELQLLWKDRMGRLEENDDREYDVFVCYDQEDAEFVLGTLVPVLEDNCRYRCFAWERDSLAGEWIPETYTQTVRQSRRFLMVLSSALANNAWCTYALYVAIDAMLSLHSRIIFVLLQDIDWATVTLVDGDPDNPTLRQVMRVVRTVKWTDTRKFWQKLRLYLPPRRALPLHFKVHTESVSSSKGSLLELDPTSS